MALSGRTCYHMAVMSLRSFLRPAVLAVPVCLCSLAAPPPAVAMHLAEHIDVEYHLFSRQIADLVDRVDQRFGEPRIEDRERKVKLAVGPRAVITEGGGQDLNLRAGARFPLPALERRANIFLDIGGDLESMGDFGTVDFSGAETNYSAAASIIARRLRPFSFGTVASAFWGDGVQWFIRPFMRFERRRDPWRCFFEQRVFYHTEKRVGERSGGYVDRILTTSSYLRFAASAEAHQELQGFDLAEALMYRRSFIHDSGLSFEAGSEFPTADTAAGESYLQVRWRGRVWRDWLEYEIRPRVGFPWDRGEKVYSVLLELKIIFEDYLRPLQAE